MRQPQLNRELVQRQFFGNKPAQPAVEEETVGDKIKARAGWGVGWWWVGLTLCGEASLKG